MVTLAYPQKKPAADQLLGFPVAALIFFRDGQ